jgi:hypothetical protein
MKNFYSFVGTDAGSWHVTNCRTLVGAALAPVRGIEIFNTPAADVPERGLWVLQGFTSNIRYANRSELVKLRAVQEGLNRSQACSAALIPIRKNAEWWAMPQDERRAIFEEQSRHTDIGLGYLPEIARQLHHARDLGEPFDFITWFEFAPEHTSLFNDLLDRLRATREWQYVDREIDIRLARNA